MRKEPEYTFGSEDREDGLGPQTLIFRNGRKLTGSWPTRSQAQTYVANLKRAAEKREALKALCFPQAS